MRAIGYLRVSTTEQAESGLGLEAQRGSIQRAAVFHGAHLEMVFTDEGLSGSLGVEDRPGLLDALNALQKGDILLVAKRDRLGRGGTRSSWP